MNQHIKEFLRFNNYSQALETFQLEEAKKLQSMQLPLGDKVPKLQKMLQQSTSQQMSP